MKRMTLIAAALCLIMITTVGAGVVAAKQQMNPRQAGASSVHFYDVPATDTHGAGKLMIDVKEHAFVFNGKGFTPDKTYALFGRITSSGFHVFAAGKATPSGNLHLAGTWEKDAALPGTMNFDVLSLGSGGCYPPLPDGTLCCVDCETCPTRCGQV